MGPGAKTIKKNSTQNKSQTQRGRAYKVTSFLSTDCELSRDMLKIFFTVPGPGLTRNFFIGKLSPKKNSPIPVLIFWSSITYMCIVERC